MQYTALGGMPMGREFGGGFPPFAGRTRRQIPCAWVCRPKYMDYLDPEPLRMEGMLFFSVDGGPQHACGIAQHGGDDGTGAVGDAQRVAVQNVPGVL